MPRPSLKQYSLLVRPRDLVVNQKRWLEFPNKCFTLLPLTCLVFNRCGQNMNFIVGRGSVLDFLITAELARDRTHAYFMHMYAACFGQLLFTLPYPYDSAKTSVSFLACTGKLCIFSEHDRFPIVKMMLVNLDNMLSPHESHHW